MASRIYRIHSTLLYSPWTPSNDSSHPLWTGVPPIQRIHPRLVYNQCVEYLKGLYPTRIHRIHLRLVYNPWDESLKGLHPSQICRIHPRLV